MTEPTDTEQRLAELERAVAVLTAELRELQSLQALQALRASRGLRSPAVAERRTAAEGPRPHVPERRRPMLDTDEITSGISKHGLALLAALVFLSGLGILVRWAVSVGHFGPSAQLAAGAALTAAFYSLGGWLWSRADERRGFARVVLSLALAATHLIAWGAGPRLQLLPDAVALAIVVVCAVSLGVLAHRADDGTLFAVGVGGALAAPLLAGVPRTAAGGDGLTLYLAAVFLTGVFAIGERRWRVSMFVLAASLAAYCALLGAWTVDVSAAAPWRMLLPVGLALLAALATRATGATGATGASWLQVGLARTATLTISALAVLLVARDAEAWVQWAAVVAGLASMRIALDRPDAPTIANDGELSHRWLVVADGLAIPVLLLVATAGADTMLTAAGGFLPSWRRAAALVVVGLLLADSLRAITTPLVVRLRSASVVGAAALLANVLPLEGDAAGIATMVFATAAAVSLAMSVRTHTSHPVARGALFAGWSIAWLVTTISALATAGMGHTALFSGAWPLATLLVSAPCMATLVATGTRAIDADRRLFSSPGLVGGSVLAAWAWISIAHFHSPLVADTGTIVFEAALGATLLVAALRRPSAYGRLRTSGLWVLGIAGIHTLVRVWGLESELVKVLVTLLVGSVLLVTAYLTRRRASATA